jgi:hypothetical protein
LNPRPLGYEPYDARLRCLAWSLVAALISVNGRGTSTPDLGVSRVTPYPAASRAQIRAQIWLLTRGITVAIASVRQAGSQCLWCCPRVAVVPLSRPPHRARGGHEPLRPELAAPLGVCPLSQLTQGVGGSSGLLLPGGVAVLCCCIGSPSVSYSTRRGARYGSADLAQGVADLETPCQAPSTTRHENYLLTRVT